MAKVDGILDGADEALDPKLIFFKDMLDKGLGLTSKVTKERESRYRLDYHTSTNTMVGYTTIDLDGISGRPILFGTSSGLFTSDGVKGLKSSIEKVFMKKFKS